MPGAVMSCSREKMKDNCWLFCEMELAPPWRIRIDENVHYLLLPRAVQLQLEWFLIWRYSSWCGFSFSASHHIWVNWQQTLMMCYRYNFCIFPTALAFLVTLPLSFFWSSLVTFFRNKWEDVSYLNRISWQGTEMCVFNLFLTIIYYI